METLARRAGRGSPSAGSSQRFLWQQPFSIKGHYPLRFLRGLKRLLSSFGRVRANHSAFVQSASFSRPATSFPKVKPLSVLCRFLFQYLAPNSHQEVAGALFVWCGFCFDFQEQKQKRIGRIPLYLFLPFPKVSPPNPHAKKIFEAERKFVCPILLGEYRVRDILLIYFSWCNDSKCNRGHFHFSVFSPCIRQLWTFHMCRTLVAHTNLVAH